MGGASQVLRADDLGGCLERAGRQGLPHSARPLSSWKPLPPGGQRATALQLLEEPRSGVGPKVLHPLLLLQTPPCPPESETPTLRAGLP